MLFDLLDICFSSKIKPKTFINKQLFLILFFLISGINIKIPIVLLSCTVATFFLFRCVINREQSFFGPD